MASSTVIHRQAARQVTRSGERLGGEFVPAEAVVAATRRPVRAGRTGATAPGSA